LFGNSYKDKKVFVTGHTGFKGSWLCLWLEMLGATVIGYSLPPPTQPNHFNLLGLRGESLINDIRDRAQLAHAVKECSPEVVFHLAAQSLVRYSYDHPVETYETNIMGTVNLLEACRETESVKAIVNVTSDKCYDNKEWLLGYRETDSMGGHDPYSASKGCAELVTASYRRSFFEQKASSEDHTILLASVRAGNIIGGGDWGKDRLIPDIIKAASTKRSVLIRNPRAIRPWQHVFEPLSGYLLLGQRLLEEKREFAEAWNFGPNDEGHKDVLSVVRELQGHWPIIDFQIHSGHGNLHEATLLKLDCSKARARLGWMPVWDSSTMILKTAQWYRDFYQSGSVLSQEQLNEYISDATQQNMSWAVS
jgi:CDP-glucose 4,6-dehydratase